MIRKEIDVHLEALAGYINDEDKMVTYKWLSKELNIHVNLSKQILFEYWDNKRTEKDPVTATFLLIGHLEDGGMRVEVVKEADLASAKKNFSKIISEHIYSLQKTLPEIELLAITDKGDSQHSAVRCTESVIRSEHEMDILRWGSSILNNKPKITNVQNSTSIIEKQKMTDTKSNEQSNNVSKESTAKITASKSGDKTQKTAFNNMFAKAIDKQNKEKTSSNENTKSKGKMAKISPPKNPWFAAAKKSDSGKEQPKTKNDLVESDVGEKTSKDQRVSNSEDSDKINHETTAVGDDSDVSPPKKNSWFDTKTKSKNGKEQSESRNGSSDFKVDDKRKEESSEIKEIDNKESSEISISSGKTGGKKKAVNTSRGKKRQSTAKNESINKKRKRIVVVESSSDESSSSEMEDVREPDEPEEPQIIEKIRSSPSPPLIKSDGGRRKVRKLVDKTFMDEDGYFVTQKEYVYESCSDKEEEVEMVNVEPSTSEPIVKNVNKRKQATLFNFFKKS